MKYAFLDYRGSLDQLDPAQQDKLIEALVAQGYEPVLHSNYPDPSVRRLTKRSVDGFKWRLDDFFGCLANWSEMEFLFLDDLGGSDRMSWEMLKERLDQRGTKYEMEYMMAWYLDNVT